MMSRSGRFIITFNGEIYNHMDLRRRLGGQVDGWTGHSDTETLLKAVEVWGVEGALRNVVGMFAFALWDVEDRILFLCRDRMGEKPLYYGLVGGDLVFASELKSIQAHPKFERNVDIAAVDTYLRFGCIGHPQAIWMGIKKLPPGSFIRCRGGELNPVPEPNFYWSAETVANQGQSKPFRGSESEARDVLQGLLREAVVGQMLADVPLGAFLSGGLDSSAIVAQMQANAHRPVKTFTIGFEERAYDESQYAEGVARHLGTDHRTLVLSAKDAYDAVPALAATYDEPFGDASALPTMLVSRLARADVKVALTGDGADELLGGYTRYYDRRIAAISGAFKVSPPLARGAASKLLRDRFLIEPGSNGSADLLSAAYEISMSQWRRPPISAPQVRRSLRDRRRSPSPMAVMRLHDLAAYLPNDILAKVDRASMSFGLETRAPFLDHRLVEFAWSLPQAMIGSRLCSKRLLRGILYRQLPRDLMERRKMGFALPLNHWLRGPLNEWANELLSPSQLARSGYLDPRPIRARWAEHLAGTHNHRDPLWVILMFQAWWLSQFG